MIRGNQAPHKEVLMPEQLLEDLEGVSECFPLVGGIMGARGETHDVEIAGYHAPMTDFFDDRRLQDHLSRTSEAPTITLPLEITPDFRYAFDNGQEWFRVGRGAFLHAAGRRVPVSVVRLDFDGFSVSWLCRDERDIEQPVAE